MFLKGFDKFREKTTMLRGIRIFTIPFYLFFIILFASFVLDQFNSYPTEISKFLPDFLLILFPIFGYALIELFGFFLLSQMWIWRDRLKKKWGSQSYQRILPVGLVGITIVIFLAFYNFNQFPNYSNSQWQANKYFIIIKPLYLFFDSPLKEIILAVQTFAGLFFLILGLALSFRSIYTFGIDYTTVIYLYFPEESSIQENQIYSVLRHPMYTGLIFISFGGFLNNLTFYGFILFIIYTLGFYFHIHYIEEKELISRFGESYKTYRKNVPFFLINPVKLTLLLKFIVKG